MPKYWQLVDKRVIGDAWYLTRVKYGEITAINREVISLFYNKVLYDDYNIIIAMAWDNMPNKATGYEFKKLVDKLFSELKKKIREEFKESLRREGKSIKL
jgi:hypothetical protein